MSELKSLIQLGITLFGDSTNISLFKPFFSILMHMALLGVLQWFRDFLDLAT